MVELLHPLEKIRCFGRYVQLHKVSHYREVKSGLTFAYKWVTSRITCPDVLLRSH